MANKNMKFMAPTSKTTKIVYPKFLHILVCAMYEAPLPPALSTVEDTFYLKDGKTETRARSVPLYPQIRSH